MVLPVESVGSEKEADPVDPVKRAFEEDHIITDTDNPESWVPPERKPPEYVPYVPHPAAAAPAPAPESTP